MDSTPTHRGNKRCSDWILPAHWLLQLFPTVVLRLIHWDQWEYGVRPLRAKGLLTSSLVLLRLYPQFMAMSTGCMSVHPSAVQVFERLPVGYEDIRRSHHPLSFHQTGSKPALLLYCQWPVLTCIKVKSLSTGTGNTRLWGIFHLCGIYSSSTKSPCHQSYWHPIVLGKCTNTTPHLCNFLQPKDSIIQKNRVNHFQFLHSLRAHVLFIAALKRFV